MSFVAIDFEASCLPRHGRSFPIEVGIAHDGVARSWIIRPHADWRGWDWTAEAEALHGLSRDRLLRDGQPAHIVMAQLAHAIGGRRVVADSLIDQYWLDTLACAAGVRRPFSIDHISVVLDELMLNGGQVADAVGEADRAHPERHRAGSDALWLSAVVTHLSAAGYWMPVPAPMRAEAAYAST